ncbi:GNAT family N-acetyltransferase [Phenylobacterium sp.]|uniref:GNAT family N-acetyltransferase n=1 Tax=Phenylobacterium sp. TaxID=1871053 RepID=UPI0030F403CA
MITITSLGAAHRDPLGDMLIEAVTRGASVSFMHPVSRETADGFWDRALAAAARDERVILGAFDGQALVGTVTLLLDCADNQPHRAEIAKMITRLSHRGRGIATALLREAERLAVQRSRTLLVLDTATDGGAAPLYEAVGFNLAGVIPDYAYKPHGGLSGTAFYWKRIGVHENAMAAAV